MYGGRNFINAFINMFFFMRIYFKTKFIWPIPNRYLDDSAPLPPDINSLGNWRSFASQSIITTSNSVHAGLVICIFK